MSQLTFFCVIGGEVDHRLSTTICASNQESRVCGGSGAYEVCKRLFCDLRCTAWRYVVQKLIDWLWVSSLREPLSRSFAVTKVYLRVRERQSPWL